MSANINNLNAVSYLPVADRKHVQSLTSDSNQQRQQDQADTASVVSTSSTSSLLKKAFTSKSKSKAKSHSEPKARSTSENLDPKKLQAQGFMSQIRFVN